MSVEENKTIARRYAQMFNTCNLDDADELFAPNFTLRHLDAPNPELAAKAGRSSPGRL